uniref:Uncharacterized protein n=1 Tax=Haemonchus placei TaxID=6290 RepID=A0A0N4VXD6_HAEPC
LNASVLEQTYDSPSSNWSISVMRTCPSKLNIWRIPSGSAVESPIAFARSSINGFILRTRSLRNAYHKP